tara:strand:+ start:181 stop:363 length:183 start_codon:yes stop_codon:yes gene_type:complete
MLKNIKKRSSAWPSCYKLNLALLEIVADSNKMVAAVGSNLYKSKVNPKLGSFMNPKMSDV